MKNICKLTFAVLAFTMIFTATELNAQSNEDSKIGLTVGLDYVSNYLYRGQYYFYGNLRNGGMFSPYAFYNIFNTGLFIGVKGEITERWFYDNNDEAKEDDLFDWFNSIDFNIDYRYSFKKIITFNIGGWYYLYKTIHYSSESFNPSSLDIYLSATIDALQLRPMIAVTYSYYMNENYYRYQDKGKNGDIYVQLGIGHSFKIFDSTYLDLDAIAGFLDKNASDRRMMERPDRIGSTDISDIDFSTGLTTTAGVLTLSASFHYIITPGTQYKFEESNNINKEIHKFYTKFGVACSI